MLCVLFSILSSFGSRVGFHIGWFFVVGSYNPLCEYHYKLIAITPFLEHFKTVFLLHRHVAWYEHAAGAKWPLISSQCCCLGHDKALNMLTPVSAAETQLRFKRDP